jgi:hypothetical protein
MDNKFTHLKRELEQERRITKALAEIADELIVEKAKRDAEAVRSGSIFYETKGITGHLEQLRKRSNAGRKNFLTRDRVTKGKASTDPHDLTTAIRKRREDLKSDRSVS